MKTFVVLGMHRSATSLIAKGLHESGIYLGQEKDMLPPAPDNPEGFYENKKFIKLNDAILHACKGNWLEPPSEEAILSVAPQFNDEIRDLVNEMEQKAEGKFWGWKDPRSVLTIRLFHPFLKNPHYIAGFRDPNDVADSLHKRNGFSHRKAYNCALIYNARLLQFLIDNHLPSEG